MYRVSSNVVRFHISIGFLFSASKIGNILQTRNFFGRKIAKEDVIWTEIAGNDTEMGCDGGDLETNEPNCVLM